jgi:hypothetical protein
MPMPGTFDDSTSLQRGRQLAAPLHAFCLVRMATGDASSPSVVVGIGGVDHAGGIYLVCTATRPDHVHLLRRDRACDTTFRHSLSILSSADVASGASCFSQSLRRRDQCSCTVWPVLMVLLVSPCRTTPAVDHERVVAGSDYSRAVPRYFNPDPTPVQESNPGGAHRSWLTPLA